ncbi:hypothetical protein MNV49_007121 [Pseudohyphozyma bogoriensis]|nr:hypothetical protein MNV49_007121 [Pseudohyphozyma bogoriensis]
MKAEATSRPSARLATHPYASSERKDKTHQSANDDHLPLDSPDLPSSSSYPDPALVPTPPPPDSSTSFSSPPSFNARGIQAQPIHLVSGTGGGALGAASRPPYQHQHDELPSYRSSFDTHSSTSTSFHTPAHHPQSQPQNHRRGLSGETASMTVPSHTPHQQWMPFGASHYPTTPSNSSASSYFPAPDHLRRASFDGYSAPSSTTYPSFPSFASASTSQSSPFDSKPSPAQLQGQTLPSLPPSFHQYTVPSQFPRHTSQLPLRSSASPFDTSHRNFSMPQLDYAHRHQQAHQHAHSTSQGTNELASPTEAEGFASTSTAAAGGTALNESASSSTEGFPRYPSPQQFRPPLQTPVYDALPPNDDLSRASHSRSNSQSEAAEGELEEEGGSPDSGGQRCTVPNATINELCARAGVTTPFPSETLVVVWDGKLSRAIKFDSNEAQYLEPHEENELLVFPRGGWVQVKDKHGYDAAPWSSGKGANDWLRKQAEHCLCKRFRFWQGQKRDPKHPSVIRDHVSACAARDPMDPLAPYGPCRSGAQKRPDELAAPATTFDSTLSAH